MSIFISLEIHQGRVVGQYGVERTYDQYLRGDAGRELIEVDALGHTKRSISVNSPRAGDDLYLTIDIRLQQLAEDLLGNESGAIVALNPITGDILALASQPSFDPNALSRGLPVSEWQELRQDSRYPLTNRAIQGQYPPGSTFKIVMATEMVSPGYQGSPLAFNFHSVDGMRPDRSAGRSIPVFCPNPNCLA